MNQGMPFLVLQDRGISPFIEALIAVWDVTGGAAHTAHIAPFIPTPYAEVAALTFSADIGEYGLRGVFFNGV